MEILILIIAATGVAAWVFLYNRSKTTTVKECLDAPYKVETPPAVEPAPVVEEAVSAEVEAAPAKKPRKPRTPRAKKQS